MISSAYNQYIVVVVALPKLWNILEHPEELNHQTTGCHDDFELMENNHGHFQGLNEVK